MERTTEHEWIAARLAVTQPHWETDARRARAALDAAHRGRTHRDRRPLRLVAAAAVVVVVAALVAPTGRAVAQELWYHLFVSRLEVVRLDLSKVPLDTNSSITGATQAAASIEEASAMAGYRVALPPADVLPGTPILSVLPAVALSQRIDRARVLAGLAAVGAHDVDVPVEWDGVTLRGTVGRSVAAEYSRTTSVGRRRDDVSILQTPPIRLELPTGFPLDRFAEAIFRAGGLSWWDARTLAQEYVAHPAWLLDVPANAAVTVETVPLAGGTAIVIGEPADGGDSEWTVFVSRPGRLYAVSSLSRERSLRVAETLR
jgi:hypothetical protein